MKTTTMRPFFGEFGTSIFFATVEECVPNNPQVSWRPKDVQEYDSSTEIQERYFLTLYLHWIFSKTPGHFKSPLRFVRAGGEREPDFLVTEASEEYGLEISRATTWRYQRASEELLKSEAGGYIESDAGLNVEHGKEGFDPKAAVLPFGTPLRCPGWLGMEPERKWAELVLDRILKKEIKLANGYSKFRLNCDLLLYYSSHIPPLCDLDFAVSELKRRHSESPSGSASMYFRQVSIVCENWAIMDAFGSNTKVVRLGSDELGIFDTGHEV
jgi:hypothetical protein